jgi:phospholipase C
VVYGENQSFDHYFGTYPNATNPPGEPNFTAAGGTPAVDGLTVGLLTANTNAANPARLDRSEPVTCDHNHNYGAEQKAFNHGLMDKFVENTGGGSCADKSIVMDYYDGNTVTAMWNIAQHFAISDRHSARPTGPRRSARST